MSHTIDLYSLKLHETITTQFGITIMRVPGGWIYDCWNIEIKQFKQGVFVPFNNEFQSIPRSTSFDPPFI